MRAWTCRFLAALLDPDSAELADRARLARMYLEGEDPIGALRVLEGRA